MNINLPPPPIQDPVGTFVWQEWFRQVMVCIQDLQQRVTIIEEA